MAGFLKISLRDGGLVCMISNEENKEPCSHFEPCFMTVVTSCSHDGLVSEGS